MSVPLADSIEAAAKHWQAQGSPQFAVSLTFEQARAIVFALRAVHGGPAGKDDGVLLAQEQTRQRLRAAMRGEFSPEGVP